MARKQSGIVGLVVAVIVVAAVGLVIMFYGSQSSDMAVVAPTIQSDQDLSNAEAALDKVELTSKDEAELDWELSAF